MNILLMKGIELPINVLVIVSIAVIVLLGLVVLYFIGFNPFSSGVNMQSLKNSACTDFALNYDCGRRGGKRTSDIILGTNTLNLVPNTLNQLCQDKLGCKGSLYDDSEKIEACCRSVCGCQ